ncbi:hypothetical protein KIPB_006452 [Kipferlia bialata]|uniref:Uncharacterized protein n=1 Tax=Kipferlia bialata TaxID=797122 RepID=A0A9K3D092_9EUKA|nr:hypothetical protein KIPB_006452 [Kipferlia bialata]|eukprot:g6452.t1
MCSDIQATDPSGNVVEGELRLPSLPRTVGHAEGTIKFTTRGRHTVTLTYRGKVLCTAETKVVDTFNAETVSEGGSISLIGRKVSFDPVSDSLHASSPRGSSGQSFKAFGVRPLDLSDGQRTSVMVKVESNSDEPVLVGFCPVDKPGSFFGAPVPKRYNGMPITVYLDGTEAKISYIRDANGEAREFAQIDGMTETHLLCLIKIPTCGGWAKFIA